jgi:hypothetical protein
LLFQLVLVVLVVAGVPVDRQTEMRPPSQVAVLLTLRTEELAEEAGQLQLVVPEVQADQAVQTLLKVHAAVEVLEVAHTTTTGIEVASVVTEQLSLPDSSVPMHLPSPVVEVVVLRETCTTRALQFLV